MIDQASSLLLITENPQIVDAVSEMVSNDAVLSVLHTVTLAEMSDHLIPSPDLVLLDLTMTKAATDEQIMAVTQHLSHQPIIVISETCEALDIPDVQDCLSPKDLQNPLLPRLFQQTIHLAQQSATKRIERQQRELTESLKNVGIKLNTTLDYDALLDDILEQIELFLSYDVAAIQLIEDEYLRIVRLHSPEDGLEIDWIRQKINKLTFHIHENQTIQTIINSGKPLVIPDTTKYSGWTQIEGQPPIRSWIGAPMIVQDHIIGIVSLDKMQPDFYKEEHVPILAIFADLAGAALYNSRIYEENQRQIEELRVLHALANASSQAVEVDELLTQCTKIVAERLYPDSFGFVLVNDDNTMSAHHAFHNRLDVIHPDKLPIGTGVVGQVIVTGQRKRVSDIRTDDDYEGIVAHTHSELCVPLWAGGEIIGAINAESILYDAFTEADERFLVTLSGQLTTAIERIQLIEAERIHQQEVAMLREATISLTASLDLEQVLTNILNRLEEVIPYDNASVILLQGNELLIAASHGSSNASSMVGKTFPATDYLFSEVRETKRPLYLTDAQENPHFHNWDDSFKVRGWICFPLIVRDRISGVLTIDHAEVGAYNDVETDLVQAFASQAAVAIENARLYDAEQQARKLAELMREANTNLLHSQNLDIILYSLIEYMQVMVPYDHVNIWFIRGDFAYVHLFKNHRAQYLVEMTDLRVNIKTDPLFKEISAVQSGLLISDVQTDAQWSQMATQKTINSQTKSWIGIPITAGGELLGFITFEKESRKFFTKEHLQSAENFTSQAAILIQNGQLLQETHQRTMELEVIASLSASLRETDELESLLRIILQKVLHLIGGSFGGIYLIKHGAEDLVLHSTWPEKPELVGLRQTVNDGVAGYVARTGRVYIVPDLLKDPLLKLSPLEIPLISKQRTGINLPLRVQERIVGVLYISLDHVHSFTDLEVKLLTTISEIAGTAIDRAMMLDTLENRVASRTEALAKANERLTELDELKTKFISDISHELRTPITNLSLYLDLLEQGSPDRREQYTAVLRRQVNRLITMIEDILSISRLDMAKVNIRPLSVEINSLINQAVARVQNQMNENVSLSTNLGENLPVMLADPQHLVQILEFLLHNAINYTKEGCIHIQSFWDEVPNRIQIEIIDTGIGIPENEIDHIFERFYRASNVSQSTMPGTGLGLPIVKELVGLNQGDLRISSELNVGTTATLVFPVNS